MKKIKKINNSNVLSTIIAATLALSMVGNSQRTNFAKDNTMATKTFEIVGNRRGQVIVKDKIANQIIRTFQMQEGIVREVFLLDHNGTIGASQKDHTIFWDLGTEQEKLRFEQRIYGFSDDETKFFTYSSQRLTVYRYPSLKIACQLDNALSIGGPEQFIFSPDHRYLAVLFHTGRPASDEYYPNSNPVRRGINKSKLFDLELCQEIQEFSELRASQLGEFTTDTKFYKLKDAFIFNDGHTIQGNWQFNLQTYQAEKI